MRNLERYSLMYSHRSPHLCEGDIFIAQVPVPVSSASGAATTPNLSEGMGAPSVVPADASMAYLRILDTDVALGTARIADMMGVSQRTVRRHMSDLVREGLVQSTGENHSRAYRLTSLGRNSM